MNKVYDLVEKGFTKSSSIPNDRHLYYRCERCKDVIPSLPIDSIGCSCTNVFIDKDVWRLVVEDFSLFSVVKRRAD